MKKATGGFVRLDAAAAGLLPAMARGEGALSWLSARWDRIVGQPLARKVVPAELSGRRLTLELLDPAWRKPVAATLPELERKLALELPNIKPRVVLRSDQPG